MNKCGPVLGLFLIFFCFPLFSQTTTSATYSAGVISVDFHSNPNVNTVSACSGDLTVNVPAGRYVTSVEVEYQMEAVGLAWIIEQRSYVECLTTGTKESAVASGSPVTSNGIETYQRSGLSFANGIVPAGGLTFRLHAFRTWGGLGCGTSRQRVLNNTFKVTVTHIPAPSCLPPSGVGYGSVTATTADLSWTTGGAANWQVEYWPSASPGSSTLANVTTNPFTLSGLSPNTSYEFRLRDSCGVGDVSFWTDTSSFRTSCSVVSAPWTEDFESSDWVASTFGNVGSVDPCFTRNSTNEITWEAGPPQFSSAFTGPAGDHTTGSGKYMFSEVNAFGSFPDSAIITTPPVDLNALNTPELSFWYHMFGSSIGELQVQVSNDYGNTFTTLDTKTGEQHTSKAAPWKEEILNLASYSDDTVILRFLAVQPAAGGNSDVAIDDISIHEQPSCPKPQNLELIGKTASTATLQWQSGGASDWNIEYGSPGFTPGTGTMLNAGSNLFTVTGLTANTAYQFYVRDSCGVGDVSFWVGPVGDTTDCNPVAAPYTENFDGAAFTIGSFFSAGNMDPCWDRINDLNYVWKPQTNNTTNGTGPDADHTTGNGKYLHADRLFSGSSIPSLVATAYTPLIDLSPLTTPELSFWYHMFGSDIDSLVVDVFDGTSWTSVLTLAGESHTSKTDPWKEAVVNISAFANDTIKVRFEAYRSTVSSFSVNMAIDDVDIHEQPSCPQPSGLSVTVTAANSVTLSWTSGGASNWQIEYGAAGFTQGSGNIVNVTTNPFTLTGLNSSTTYDFYVRDSCGATDLSAWHGTATASTNCLPVVAPFTENFDGPQWVIGPNFNDTGSVANCWDRTPIADYLWKPGPAPFTSFGTGPSADHTSGSGKFIYTESIFGGGSLPFDAFLETPEIDLSALTSPELSFWYHMFGSAIGSLEVEVDDGSGYTSVFTLTGEQQNARTDSWKEAIISLASYANDTIRIRFKGSKSVFSTQADVAVDDISVHEAPPCPKPSNLTATPTSDGFSLSWTSGGASDWQIEYGPVGFTPGSGTRVNTSSNPFTLTGLSTLTTYDIYVRDSCNATELSAWFGPVTDSTLCNVFSAPFSENFDGGTWIQGAFINDPGTIDQCWGRSHTAQYFWKVGQNGTSSFGTGPDQDHTTGSGKFMYCESAGTSNSNTSFSSPLIDLSSLTNPQLRFWYHMFGSGIDKLEVEVWAGSGWTNVSTIMGQQQNSENDPWQEEIISLSSFVNDTLRVRVKAFRIGTGFQADIAIDDFWIGEAPSCPRPSNLTSTASTTNSISISWTSGGASDWLIGYRPSGTTGPLSIVPVNTNPHTLTGLSPSTSYAIFVKDSCAAGDVSLWEGPLILSTDCGVPSAPWTEDFDGADWVPGTGPLNIGNQISSCWSRPSTANPNFGTRSGATSSGATGPATDASGSGKYIYTEASSGASGSGEITSPSIYIPTSLVNPRLRFAYHMFGAGIVSLNVELDDGSGFTNVLSISGQQHTSNNTPWLTDSIALSSYSGDTVQLRFIGTNTTFTGDIALDEIQVVSDPILCPDPSNLGFSTITTSSADAGWISNSGNSQLEVVPLGQAQGTGTMYTGLTPPFSISGLQPNTIYVVYVRDSCNGSAFSDWINDTLSTQPCPVVSADFGYTTNILKVNFDASATNNADSLYWDLGDGSDTSGAHPKHSYAAAGTYTVTLIASNFCGNVDTLVKTIEVCDTLTADFSSAQSGDTVVLDAGQSQGAAQYHWDLGNGKDTTGALVHYAYPGAGSKIVVLTVVNACGDSASVQKVVEVCLPPVADWTYDIIGTTGSGMQVQFDATNSKNASSYEWDFGDGNTATGAVQPVHTYLTPGLFYTVKLTVTNDCGDKNTRRYKLSEIGLEEINLNRIIKLYPNPATDKIVVEWPARNIVVEKMELIDVSGRKLMEYSVPEGESRSRELDISRLARGYLVLRIYTDKGISDRQLILR